MRNFKRFLSLLTALVMVAAFLAMPAYATDPDPLAVEELGTDNGLDAADGLTALTIVSAAIQGTVAGGADAATVKSAVENFIFLDMLAEDFVMLEKNPADDSDINYKTLGFESVAAWKVGSGNWSEKTLDAKALKGLFNKGGALSITNSYDKKNKRPTAGVAEVKILANAVITKAAYDKLEVDGKEGKFDAAKNADGDAAGTDPVTHYKAKADVITTEAVPAAIILTFAKLEERPKPTKLSVAYDIIPDDTGATLGKWVLVTKDKPTTPVFDNLIITIADDGKKLSGDEVWYEFPEYLAAERADYISDNKAGGIKVKAFDYEAKKPTKTTYFVRQGAYAKDNKFYPAAKVIKVSATSAGKAPSVKPDYKTSVIPLKAGQALYIDSTANDADDPAWVKYGKEAVTARGIVAAVKDKTKLPSFAPMLGVSSKYVKVFTMATAKKPASVMAYIQLANAPAAPATADDVELTVDEKGKVSVADKKKWEFNLTPSKAGSKWGGFPKVTAAANGVGVRAKNTAKQEKTDIVTVADLASCAVKTALEAASITVAYVSLPKEETAAAGTVKTFNVTWGDLPGQEDVTGTKKKGITGFTFS
ncbi:MAG: hypothetical protein LBI19_05125 [Oscillospiraceae bacterium]|jgi:hypothetical protein|nr:hypothetical protein [Oscillospiraceae bacterium]